MFGILHQRPLTVFTVLYGMATSHTVLLVYFTSTNTKQAPVSPIDQGAAHCTRIKRFDVSRKQDDTNCITILRFPGDVHKLEGHLLSILFASYLHRGVLS